MENGCLLYDNCFTCPYPDCIENRTVDRDKWAARRLVNQGYTIRRVALELGKSERQVRRLLKEVKDETGRL